MTKYLITYAEPEAQTLQFWDKIYNYVIVIPICDENSECLSTIFTNIAHDNFLIVLVVNSPVAHSDFQSNNEKLINKLLKDNKATGLNFNCKLLNLNKNDILLVDRNSFGRQIEKKQGVGQARKIGADIALQLFSRGQIKCPWIFSTDADATLPANYFTQFSQDLSKYSAIVLDFEHYSQDDKLNQLQFLYDFKLRYYLAGINYAQSSYNYIPLGSTLIVNMQCYAQVRGFPKRNAGEDFYIMNKLAKIKPIKYKLSNSIVQIKSRFSNRVPFGTGPALIQINELKNTSHYRYYNPMCFILLKQWCQFLFSMWKNNQLSLIKPNDENMNGLYTFFKCEAIFLKSKKQITSQKRWQQFVSQWFDAFKVLKAVHYFDTKYSRLNYLQLLNDKSFAKVNSSHLQKFITRYDKN